MPRRQIMAQFSEGARFHPSAKLIVARLTIEFIRIILPLTIFLACFCGVLTIIGDIAEATSGVTLTMELFPLLYLLFLIAIGGAVLALKWLVIGRYKPTTAPLWSFFVWRTELVTSTYENLAVPLLLDLLRGTPYLNLYLRLLGAEIGKRVFMDTTDITEFDLVQIGDDVAVNDSCGLQTHLFEDRVMKVSRVIVDDRATLGANSIILYDSFVEADAELGDLSVLMKGEVLPAGTVWEGSPARPVGCR